MPGEASTPPIRPRGGGGSPYRGDVHPNAAYAWRDLAHYHLGAGEY